MFPISVYILYLQNYIEKINYYHILNITYCMGPRINVDFLDRV